MAAGRAAAPMASSGEAGSLVQSEEALPAILRLKDVDAFVAVIEHGGDAAGTEHGQEWNAEAALLALLNGLGAEAQRALWCAVLKLTKPFLEPVDRRRELDEFSGKVIHAVSTLMAVFVDRIWDAKQQPALPPEFVEVANLCQELLLSLPDPGTQALIARSLERLCMDGFQGREDFYGGVLMYILNRCVSPKATNADVTRLYKVRSLIGELDWEHESIESLKMQLLRCTASPAFVRSHHGPDLLALFHVVHPGFTAEVHSTVKNQVLYSRPNALKGYSMGLFKAWKSSEGGARVQVEQCVQDWLLLAIQTCRKSADRARAVLEELHRHRHEEPVNELLCRLYAPVLWRDLRVANWQVRENAARMLQYALPLLPNDIGVAEKEQELAKQFRLLRETLEDPSEPVRRVGVSAVCIILKIYWDMIPAADTAEMLTVLMNKSSHDRKAPMVRAAVAEGFGWILENPLSHPTMAAVLPQTAVLLNDRVPLVRAAFVNLLQAVNCCRGISVSSVVSTEALFLRLASEHTEGQAERLQRGAQACRKVPAAASGLDSRGATSAVVARQLARLMAPSLFQQEMLQQVRRCNYMLQHCPLALLALLVHCREIVPAPDRVKLAAALFHYGLREANGAAPGAPADGEERPKIFATVLRVVGVLLEGVGTATEAPKQKKGKRGRTESFPKELESFVYEHIREEDFLHLLRASHEETSQCLRQDLLFALSPLDPERLPRTAELVRQELELLCRGGGDANERAGQGLLALMRTAAKWNMLGPCLEPAWERLQAAAVRLKQRQHVAEDASTAVTVVEAVLRDPAMRQQLLPLKERAAAKIVEDCTAAFCSAWSTGLEEVQKPHASKGAALLGPAATMWPRMLGFVFRLALHYDHRMQGSQEKEPQEPPTGRAAAAEASLRRVAQVLTSSAACAASNALQAAASAGAGSSQPPTRKRSKKSSAPGAVAGLLLAPSDADAVLRVHERLLEALNVAQLLLPLRPAVAQPPQDSMPIGSAALLWAVEDRLWCWAGCADTVAAVPDGPRLPQVWVFMGRLLQQRCHTDFPTPDVIEGLRRLLRLVNDAVPKEDAELKRVLQQLFSRLEYEPQLVQLVAELLGDGLPQDQDRDEPPAAPSNPALGDIHPRVKDAVTELLPSFRNLRRRLIPGAAEADVERLGPEDKRRIFTSPTPQQAGARRVGRAAPVDSRGIDRESLADGTPGSGRSSVVRRSFSVRSRSPVCHGQETDERLSDSVRGSLFNSCFEKVSVASHLSRPEARCKAPAPVEEFDDVD